MRPCHAVVLPSAEEGFAVAGIKNASRVRRVTVPRAEPDTDKNGTSVKNNSGLKEQHYISGFKRSNKIILHFLLLPALLTLFR